MDFYSFPPIAVILDTAHTIVTVLAGAVAPVAGEAAAAAAIVILTVLVRTLLIPVGISQVRAELTRKRLAPRIQELQRRHKKNPELLQRKTMELYAAEKASPFAGCLPMLLQLPVLSALYGLFILHTIHGSPNALLGETILGVPLGASLVSGPGWPGAIVFMVLLMLIALVAWGSRRLAKASLQTQPDASGPLRNLGGVLGWMPFLTVVFGALVPLAATLYLTVTTAWTLGERVVLHRILTPRSGAAES